MSDSLANKTVVGKEHQPIDLAKFGGVEIKRPIRIISLGCQCDRSGLIITYGICRIIYRSNDLHHWRISIGNLVGDRVTVSDLSFVIHSNNLEFQLA